MLQLSLRIYLAANLLLFFFFALFFFPEGVGWGLVVALFALLFSAPVIALLTGCLLLVQRFRPGVTVSWLLLATGVAICAFVPGFLLNLFVRNFFDDHLLLLSFGCAFGGLLCQALPIHRYFKKLSHETEFEIEND